MNGAKKKERRSNDFSPWLYRCAIILEVLYCLLLMIRYFLFCFVFVLFCCCFLLHFLYSTETKCFEIYEEYSKTCELFRQTRWSSTWDMSSKTLTSGVFYPYSINMLLHSNKKSQVLDSLSRICLPPFSLN